MASNTGIPVVTIPDAGHILGRPRKEALYDSEGWDSGAAIAAKITIFRDSNRFTNTSVGLTKSKPRDTNMEAQTGLPRGQHLHWYYTKNKMRYLGANLFRETAIVALDIKRRIRESTWWSFWFSQSAQYVSLQLWQIPEACDILPGDTTYNATTLISPSSCEVDREQVLDMTMNGVPTDLGQQEVFFATIESNGVTPTPTFDLYDTCILGGYFLKGIQ